MAFGKDPRGLNAVTPFGGGTMSQRVKWQQQKQAESSAQRRAGGGGGGGMGPHWRDTYRLPQDDKRWLRYIKGEYLHQYAEVPEGGQEPQLYQETIEYFPYFEHRDPISKKTAVCSGGPFRRFKNKREPCHGCDKYWADGSKDLRGKYMSLAPLFAFTIYDYGLWVKMPSEQTNQQGQPYYNWIMVPPNDQRLYQYEHKVGNLLAWPMYKTHMEQVFGYMDSSIANDCASCGTSEAVSLMGRVCGNPACRCVAYDPRVMHLTPEQLKQFEKPWTCSNCGQTTFLEEVLGCYTCQQRNMVPKRATIFDVDLELTTKLSGQNNNRNIVPCRRSQPRPMPLDPQVLATIKPLQLDKKFAPTPLADQAKLWNITNATQIQVPGSFPGAPPGSPSLPHPLYAPPGVQPGGFPSMPPAIPQAQAAFAYGPPAASPNSSWSQPQVPTAPPSMVPPTSPWGQPQGPVSAGAQQAQYPQNNAQPSAAPAPANPLTSMMAILNNLRVPGL